MLLLNSLKKSNIIINAKSKNRWDLIEEIIDRAVKNKDILFANKKNINNALIEREKSMSTGIGNGVAIPHCTTTTISETLILMAISKNDIDFDSIDNNPVRIIILLIVPKNKLSQHIKILANIAKIMSDSNLREKLLSIKTPEALIKALKSYSPKK
jgi:fructose PTS system EIIA component